MKKLTIAIFLLLTNINYAMSALIVGNDATFRSTYDGWSNFVVGHLNETFNAAGNVTGWSVYTGSAGTVGALVLRNTIDPDVYEIVSADYETVNAAGLYNFNYIPDSGDSFVQAGDFLGVFVGTAGVRFDFSTDVVRWTAGGNGTIPTTSLVAGNTLDLNTGNSRTYSMNMTYSVSEPSAIAILGLTLIVLGRLRRKS